MKSVCSWMCALSLLLCLPIEGREWSKERILEAAREFRQANAQGIISEYFEFLSIPNVSGDGPNVRRNALFIKKMFEKRGVTARVIETAGNPVVFAELKVSNAEKTLMFYAHYDGQPVDRSEWIDSEPFTPILRPGKLEPGTTGPKPIPLPGPGETFDEDWRVYARSTSDDKAPFMAIVSVLDAFQKAGMSPRNNLKFIFEGEEEAGSTNLRPFLEKHRDLLKADILFMCDGPAYYSGDPTFFFGVRGITTIEIKVYGPNTSLHSGHYGNWAPNPGFRLSKLLASMKDENGKVLVEGFYEPVIPLTETAKQALRRIPPYDDHVKENYGFVGTEGGGISLMEAIQLPSLNVNGLSSGWVGEQARTIIPPDARASIDIRLVKGCDPQYMVERVIAHVQKQGYHVVQREPDRDTRMRYPLLAKITSMEKGYKAYRTSMESPSAQSLARMFEGYYEKQPVFLPSLGGSLPIYLFDEALGIPVIGVSVANHDNNQHQPNENIRIGNLWTAIDTFAALFCLELN